MAIQAAVKFIRDLNINNENITILSDIQATIRALGSNVINSRTVYGCQKYLNMVARRYNVHIVWISEHNSISGNCTVHELAKRDTTIVLSYEFLSIGVLKNL